MQDFDIVKEIDPPQSFRVSAIIGKYDISPANYAERFSGEIDLDGDWQIGVIYGASGTGKTLISKELFEESYIDEMPYSAQTVLDDFDKKLDIEVIEKALTSVGFSSPPSWLKPYSVLSMGEKMRVDLARALLSDQDLVVFDEYTSTVNRDVAKIGSLAIQKAIRRTDKRFIAVACHDDIIKWLQPDWSFCTNTMTFERRSLRQPKIKLDIYREKGRWDAFRKYHYLSHKLVGYDQFIAYWREKPVGLVSLLRQPHSQVGDIMRVGRLVVMPDYQGVGIGHNLLEYVSRLYSEQGNRVHVVTSAPGLIHYFKKSDHWDLKSWGRKSGHKGRHGGHGGLAWKNVTSGSANRNTTSWEYNDA